ncbi:MAG: 8-amino-7-oxononanoate synthase [Deltaproteobacteria bacterium]|nr:8-amino-7-oxononanoate synthase [Deltaproteobacteria bacterium]
MSGDDFATRALQARAAAGLMRRMRMVDGPQDTWVTVDGQRALLLCSNNYLGLANEPRLIAAAQRAATDFGVGSGASRLISGSMRLHHELEERLAVLKHTQAALLFNSGYQANVGTITALVGVGDAVFSDALNHASIIDGCRLSRSRVCVYPHNDLSALEHMLQTTAARRRLIVSDSIFSMDGDTARLRPLCDLAERYDAMVMVDEAHATGVVGPNGAGVVEAQGLQERVTVQMGTLGKALGSFGAFVAARRSIVDLLINTARSFIYTTALPPPVVAAALAALDIVRDEPQRRLALAQNSRFLWSALRQLGLDVAPEPGHILPIFIGDATTTMRLSEQLLEAGAFVQGIRPPTVPDGTARLRATVMSTHTHSDLEAAVACFSQVLRSRPVAAQGR